MVTKTTTTVTAAEDGSFAFSLPDLSVSILEVGGANTTSAAAAAPSANARRSSRVMKKE